MLSFKSFIKENSDIGINVRSDTEAGISYADKIVDGEKYYETRDTNSLKPYIGKRVSIVKTGEGKAKAIGAVTIGEPVVVDETEFRKLHTKHLVPMGSQFDIKPNGTKHLYPMLDPERYDKERDVAHGIISRKVLGL